LRKIHVGYRLASDQVATACVRDRESVAAIAITGEEVPL